MDVPVEYLKYLQEHKIDPSGNFIKRYSAFYNVVINTDALLNLDKEYFIPNLTANKENQQAGKNKLPEIIQMLSEDEEAQEQILSLLWGRKIRKGVASKSEKKNAH
jgi:NAD-specific glutamate dehydrogenase